MFFETQKLSWEMVEKAKVANSLIDRDSTVGERWWFESASTDVLRQISGFEYALFHWSLHYRIMRGAIP